MNLYLVRHSEALSIGGAVLRDADRPLSPRGEHDAAIVGRLLAMVEPSVRMIGCSPLVRAQQTATILASQFSTAPAVHPWPVLAPGIDMRVVLTELMEHAEGSLILVAHQPDLTEFISWLIADGAAEMAFPPGAVASLVLSTTSAAGAARLQWIVPPVLVSLLHPEW
jgi:phosphohistidine phosphatase